MDRSITNADWITCQVHLQDEMGTTARSQFARQSRASTEQKQTNDDAKVEVNCVSRGIHDGSNFSKFDCFESRCEFLNYLNPEDAKRRESCIFAILIIIADDHRESIECVPNTALRIFFILEGGGRWVR